MKGELYTNLTPTREGGEWHREEVNEEQVIEWIVRWVTTNCVIKQHDRYRNRIEIYDPSRSRTVRSFVLDFHP